MLLYKSLESIAAMMVSIGCESRLLLSVPMVAIFLAIVVLVITMGVTGILMAIESNGARVAIATVIGDIAAAGRRSEGLWPEG
uniref:Uncharacterized protein n=1 Tax=Romanomermis culicivorax TaxID=13658 RepID=A0A915JZR8_ROMCU